MKKGSDKVVNLYEYLNKEVPSHFVKYSIKYKLTINRCSRCKHQGVCMITCEVCGYSECKPIYNFVDDKLQQQPPVLVGTNE